MGRRGFDQRIREITDGCDVRASDSELQSFLRELRELADHASADDLPKLNAARAKVESTIGDRIKQRDPIMVRRVTIAINKVMSAPVPFAAKMAELNDIARHSHVRPYPGAVAVVNAARETLEAKKKEILESERVWVETADARAEGIKAKNDRLAERKVAALTERYDSFSDLLDGLDRLSRGTPPQSVHLVAEARARVEVMIREVQDKKLRQREAAELLLIEREIGYLMASKASLQSKIRHIDGWSDRWAAPRLVPVAAVALAAARDRLDSMVAGERRGRTSREGAAETELSPVGRMNDDVTLSRIFRFHHPVVQDGAGAYPSPHKPVGAPTPSEGGTVDGVYRFRFLGNPWMTLDPKEPEKEVLASPGLGLCVRDEYGRTREMLSWRETGGQILFPGTRVLNWLLSSEARRFAAQFAEVRVFLSGVAARASWRAFSYDEYYDTQGRHYDSPFSLGCRTKTGEALFLAPNIHLAFEHPDPGYPREGFPSDCRRIEAPNGMHWDREERILVWTPVLDERARRDEYDYEYRLLHCSYAGNNWIYARSEITRIDQTLSDPVQPDERTREWLTRRRRKLGRFLEWLKDGDNLSAPQALESFFRRHGYLIDGGFSN